MDVDNEEKKAEKQGRHCFIHHLRLQPSPAKDTVVPKPRLLSKLHPLPRADTSRVAIRKIIWLVEKFIIGCMSKQNCKQQTSNLALLQIASQSKDGDGFPWEKALLILCVCLWTYIIFQIFSIHKN